MKWNSVVKKLLSVMLMLCLFLPAVAMAGLEDDTYHSFYSIIDCEKSLSNKLYKTFRQAGELSIVIPGCPQDFVPQGLAYYAPKNLIFFSGYSSDKNASTLISANPATGEIVKEIFLKNPDGSWYTGHAGGVSVTDKNIFISDKNKLYRLPMSAYEAAEFSDVGTFVEAIPVPCEASYCQLNNGILWVGEFYHDDKKDEKDYLTDPSHEVKGPDGTTYYSWILGYKLVNYTENELDPACITANGAIPDYVLITPIHIQGLTFSGGKIFLSQSYGRANDSTIYRYGNVLGTDPHMKVQVLGVPRPAWFLNAAVQESKLISPPMSEGLCTIGDSVYISFESAATKYREPKKKDEDPSRDPLDRLFKLNPYGF
ncbi:MAG: hypothetical protein IKK08_06525 [Clostridia bacterium]|nr:hypothetical protein [Clostridia bacterium]